MFVIGIFLLPACLAAVVDDGEIKRWRQEPTLFLGHGSDNRCHIGRQKNVLCKITRSTPKMKKKARGMFALVEGDCEWVIFSGRNYKGSSQHLSQLQSVRLGVIRSARLLCSSHRSSTRFSIAGSSGISLMTSLALVGILILVAILASSWRRSRSKETLEEVDKEEREGSLEEEGQELQDMVAGNRSCNSERSLENCEAGKAGALDGKKLDPLIVPRN